MTDKEKNLKKKFKRGSKRKTNGQFPCLLEDLSRGHSFETKTTLQRQQFDCPSSPQIPVQDAIALKPPRTVWYKTTGRENLVATLIQRNLAPWNKLSTVYNSQKESQSDFGLS